MSRIHGFVFSAVLFSTLPISAASAQAGAGALRVGADLSVLTISHYPTPDLPVASDPTVLFGLYGTVAGLENYFLFAPHFGYAIIDNLILGAHLGLAVASFVGSDAGFGFHLVPFLEYLFGGETLRPFVGAEIGPRFVTVPSRDATVTLAAGAYGGVHIFVTNAFSISPFMRADFLYYSGNERAGYEVVLGVSLEGWIGGAQTDAEPSTSPTWQSPTEPSSSPTEPSAPQTYTQPL